MAAAQLLTDQPARPKLRHASSTFTARDVNLQQPSSPSSPRSAAVSPSPSVQSFRSTHAESSEGSRRAKLLAAKRSMPQLHNIWENFLEEAAEDVQSFDFPLPPASQANYATAQGSSRSGALPASRHLHAHTTSFSSILTTTSSSVSLTPVNTSPRSPPSNFPQPQSPSSNRLRPRGHARVSHQTSSSTSSATTSNGGSTSSMAAFSSASSMTTAYDDSDDALHGRDDPVPPAPPSSSAVSPISFKFSDSSLSPSPVQRLRKSPMPTTLPLQTVPRGVSPSSSTSSESLDSSTISYSHSQSTTPTPSSACPTPSPSPCRHSPMLLREHNGRLSPGVLSTGEQYRRSPEGELFEPAIPLGSPKARKSTSSQRYSSATVNSRQEQGLCSPYEPSEGTDNNDEDVLSELGYYGSSSMRSKSPQHRPSLPVISASPPESPASTGFPVVPPLRRSSRQNLLALAAQSDRPLSLPRAKSASNIRHDVRDTLRQPRQGGTVSVNPIHTKDVATAASSVAPVYHYDRHAHVPARPQFHARSQTLQDGQLPLMRDPSRDVGVNSSAPVTSSRPGQGRLRAGSASVVYSYTQSDARTPVRPPPAPPLDMTPSRLQPPAVKESSSASPLTPSSAVQWGYAL